MRYRRYISIGVAEGKWKLWRIRSKKLRLQKIILLSRLSFGALDFLRTSRNSWNVEETPMLIYLRTLICIYFFGSENTNSVPTPSVLITFTFSPWACIASFTIASPRPVPFLSFPRERSVL